MKKILILSLAFSFKVFSNEIKSDYPKMLINMKASAKFQEFDRVSKLYYGESIFSDERIQVPLYDFMGKALTGSWEKTFQGRDSSTYSAIIYVTKCLDEKYKKENCHGKNFEANAFILKYDNILDPISSMYRQDSKSYVNSLEQLQVIEVNSTEPSSSGTGWYKTTSFSLEYVNNLSLDNRH
ncbi:MAG: hypothetical protein ACXVLQ_04460 [Bacteriovorax sp.]